MTSGTVPTVRVGLLTTVLPDCWAESVLIDEAEEDRAGLLGRPESVGHEPAGTGLAFITDGEVVWVGVGRGVLFADELVEGTGWWWCAVGVAAV